jgi:hypothetical protein
LNFYEWLRDRKNRRIIPHRLEQCGYVRVRNDAAEDGLFKINGRRQAVYAKASLSIRDRLEAARELMNPWKRSGVRDSGDRIGQPSQRSQWFSISRVDPFLDYF